MTRKAKRAMGYEMDRDVINWRRVQKISANFSWNDEHLIWIGHIAKCGHGQVWYEGRAFWVHKLMYAAFIGSVPAGHDVHHTCDRKDCCKPGHLELRKRADHTRHHNKARADNGQ